MKTTPSKRSLVRLLKDLERRLAVMRTHVLAARAPAQQSRELIRSEAGRGACRDLDVIDQSSGRMDLALGQFETCLHELKGAAVARPVIDAEALDHRFEGAREALAFCLDLLGQLEHEGLARWKVCADGSARAWLQWHAQFNLLRAQLKEARVVIDEAIDRHRQLRNRGRTEGLPLVSWVSRSMRMLLS